MGNLIKARLAIMGNRQIDLLEELRKRGYPNLYATQLSSYINGHACGPQATAVKDLILDVLKEWEQENGARRD